MYQPKLIDIPADPIPYNIYHDESGTYKQGRWFIVGLLFVSERKEAEVVDILRNARNGYDGEIHFSDLPKSWRGKWNRKAVVARNWLRLYQSHLAGACSFTVLAVDTHSPAYEHRRFSERFHAYNRFSAMALLSGVAWHLSKLEKVIIQIYSDDKCRRGQGRSDLRADNFAEYVPWRLIKDVEERRVLQPDKYPEIISQDPVICISSNAVYEPPGFRNKCELIQLTDVLLGSVAQAIRASSTWPTKRDLAAMVADWIKDTCKEPWKQQYRLHRKFNVWYFPDRKGEAYNDGPLAIMPRCQMSLEQGAWQDGNQPQTKARLALSNLSYATKPPSPPSPQNVNRA
jgi:hypothetical protein